MKPRAPRRTRAVLAVAVVLASTGCAGAGGGPAKTGAGSNRISGSITVAAAASLRGALTQVGRDFERAHPGTEVRLSVDSSSTLADGIVAGAPADVFASADQPSMDTVVGAGLLAGAPVTIARNRLAIVTKAGNPEGIETLADLVPADTVALCAREAPCGRLATAVLEDAGVGVPEERVTRGQNAGATLHAVSEGDAVAGIVYVTDALAAGDLVSIVDLPATAAATTAYPAAALAASARPATARAFVDHLAGPAGRAVLVRFGFLPPA